MPLPYRTTLTAFRNLLVFLSKVAQFHLEQQAFSNNQLQPSPCMFGRVVKPNSGSFLTSELTFWNCSSTLLSILCTILYDLFKTYHQMLVTEPIQVFSWEIGFPVHLYSIARITCLRSFGEGTGTTPSIYFRIWWTAWLPRCLAKINVFSTQVRWRSSGKSQRALYKILYRRLCTVIDLFVMSSMALAKSEIRVRSKAIGIHSLKDVSLCHVFRCYLSVPIHVSVDLHRICRNYLNR